MNFIKKHKLLSAFLAICFCFVLIIIIICKDYIFIDDNDLYGNRLKDIEKVAINNKDLQKMGEALKDNDKVLTVDIGIKGRIINCEITVDEEINLDEAKALPNKLLEQFSDDEKKYYDYQVFLLSKNKESEIYPKIAYKHNTSDIFYWTNN